MREIARALDRAAVAAFEVAHGDGRSGLSFNHAFSAHTDWDWLLEAADALEREVLTTLLLPGIGTVEDLHRAYDIGTIGADRHPLHQGRRCRPAHRHRQGDQMDVAGVSIMSYEQVYKYSLSTVASSKCRSRRYRTSRPNDDAEPKATHAYRH